MTTGRADTRLADWGLSSKVFSYAHEGLSKVLEHIVHLIRLPDLVVLVRDGEEASDARFQAPRKKCATFFSSCTLIDFQGQNAARFNTVNKRSVFYYTSSL